MIAVNLGKAIQRRWQKLNNQEFIKISISEVQRREIESLYVLNVPNPTTQIYNDVLCDILDLLQIDYEIDRKRGMILTGEE
jgi:hypothetical protein